MEVSEHVETKLAIGLSYQLKYKRMGDRVYMFIPEIGISASCKPHEDVDDNVYKLTCKLAKAVVRYMTKNKCKRLKNYYDGSLKRFKVVKKRYKIQQLIWVVWSY